MNAGARDTINIDESVHEIYKELTEANDPVNVPFKTMKDVFLWAVCLGFKNGSRKKLSGKKITIFRWAQFSHDIDIPIVKAISIAVKEDPTVLASRDACLEILEEYANGSIHDLRLILQREGSQTLYRLVEEINEM